MQQELHLSEISSSMSMSLAAKPSRLNSGATERAVTWPCHSSRATEPSAFPMTEQTAGQISEITNMSQSFKAVVLGLRTYHLVTVWEKKIITVISQLSIKF